jgi:hypothetical protein
MLESTVTLSSSYVYSESSCGGSRAGPIWHSISGVHTHMANTCAIDPKVLEKHIPMLIRNVSLRKGSGGDSVICVFKPESISVIGIGHIVLRVVRMVMLVETWLALITLLVRGL